MKSTPVSIGFAIVGIIIAALIGYYGFMSEDATFKPVVTETASKDQTKVAETPEAEKTQDETPSEDAAATEAISPSFDVVRVEPDGSAVIAGRSEPEWTVELNDNGTVIGKEKAGISGEWVIVPNKTLTPGDHELTLSAKSPDGEKTVASQDSVTVVVPETAEGDLLVALNKPGEAIQILNKPETEQKTVVADSGQSSDSNTETAEVTEEGNQPVSDEQPTSVASGEAETTAEETAGIEQGEETNTTVAHNDSGNGVTAEADGQAVSQQATVEEPAASTEAETSVADSGAGAGAEGEQTPSTEELDVAELRGSTDETSAGQDNSGADTDSVSDAGTVEEQTEVAGQSNETQDDSQSVASTETAPAEETSGEQFQVAAGESDADTGSDVDTTVSNQGEGSATAPAETESAQEETTETAQSTETDASAEPSVSETTTAVADADTGSQETAAPKPEVSVEAVELENGQRLFVAGKAKTPGTIRIYVNDKPVGDVNPRGGHWLLDVELALVPGNHQVRVDQLNDSDGKVVARAEVTFERLEDAVAESTDQAPIRLTGSGTVSTGSGEKAKANVGAPGNVIIRKGDNLWTISRRLYGQGIRFSTIYLANTDQIRNPDLIYPGQVFVLPEGDAAWSN
ncbi:LysM peptidoglycan-binding domain-containing protein [Coralliovum pocilloporae]|uniref:LysM peptidoglycan-binding domain-containing protein n=1 Tax=Coralliovum pocilloporae TaxID=3066369 RepID=UPI003306E472